MRIPDAQIVVWVSTFNMPPQVAIAIIYPRKIANECPGCARGSSLRVTQAFSQRVADDAGVTVMERHFAWDEGERNVL
jgi:hypothetical protein